METRVRTHVVEHLLLWDYKFWRNLLRIRLCLTCAATPEDWDVGTCQNLFDFPKPRWVNELSVRFWSLIGLFPKLCLAGTIGTTLVVWGFFGYGTTETGDEFKIVEKFFEWKTFVFNFPIHLPQISLRLSHITFKFLLNNFQLTIRLFSQIFCVIN